MSRINLPSEVRIKSIDSTVELPSDFEQSDTIVDNSRGMLLSKIGPNDSDWTKIVATNSIKDAGAAWNALNPNGAKVGNALRYLTRAQINAVITADEVFTYGEDTGNGTYLAFNAINSVLDMSLYENGDLIFDSIEKVIVRRNNVDYNTYVAGLQAGVDVDPYDLWSVVLDDEFMKTLDTSTFDIENLQVGDIVVDSTSYDIYRVSSAANQKYWDPIHRRDSFKMQTFDTVPNVEDYAAKDVVITQDSILYKPYSSSLAWSKFFDTNRLGEPSPTHISNIGDQVSAQFSTGPGTVSRTLFAKSRGFSPSTYPGQPPSSHATESNFHLGSGNGVTYGQWVWLKDQISSLHEIHVLKDDVSMTWNSGAFHNRLYGIIGESILPTAEVYNYEKDSSYVISMNNFEELTVGYLKKIEIWDDVVNDAAANEHVYIIHRFSDVDSYYKKFPQATYSQDGYTITIPDPSDPENSTIDLLKQGPVTRNATSWQALGSGVIFDSSGNDRSIMITQETAMTLTFFEDQGTKYLLKSELTATDSQGNSISSSHMNTQVGTMVYATEDYDDNLDNIDVPFTPLTDIVQTPPALQVGTFLPFLRLDTGEQTDSFSVGYRQRAIVKTLKPIQSLSDWSDFDIGKSPLFSVVIESI